MSREFLYKAIHVTFFVSDNVPDILTHPHHSSDIRVLLLSNPYQILTNHEYRPQNLSTFFFFYSRN